MLAGVLDRCEQQCKRYMLKRLYGDDSNIFCLLQRLGFERHYVIFQPSVCIGKVMMAKLILMGVVIRYFKIDRNELYTVTLKLI